MLSKLEMEDIWNKKPVGYLRENYFGRKKLKRVEVTFQPEMNKTKKLDPVFLTVSTRNVNNYGTSEYTEIYAKLCAEIKAKVKAEGFDDWHIYVSTREIK